MEPISDRARAALEDHRARTGFGPGREQAVRERLEASIAAGAAEDFVAELDQAEAAHEGKGDSPATAASKRARIGGMLALALAAGLAGVWWVSAERAKERAMPPPPAAAYDGQVEPTSERAEPKVPHASAGMAPAPELAPEPDTPVEAPAPVVDDGDVRASKPARPDTSKSRRKPTADTDSGSESTLAAELAVLREARARIARGDRAGALRELDRHADRFPHGQLEPERDALRVEVLCELDPQRGELARARFLARHPGSGHAKRVRALTCKSAG